MKKKEKLVHWLLLIITHIHVYPRDDALAEHTKDHREQERVSEEERGRKRKKL